MFHLSRRNLLAAASHNRALLLFFTCFLYKIRKKASIALLKISFFSSPCEYFKEHASYGSYE